MSATVKTPAARPGPRADDPRVLRSRAAALEAARTLFLQRGYAGTTMDEIAERAGLTKRTLYNNYADKETLFTEIVNDTLHFAESFVDTLREEFASPVPASQISTRLHALGQRLALAILRPETIALRRLLIGESREFPALAREYFDRAPGQVMRALARGFRQLSAAGVLRTTDHQRAAEQFAYLVAGASLDRAILTGEMPSTSQLTATARAGVDTFLARFAPTPRRSR